MNKTERKKLAQLLVTWDQKYCSAGQYYTRVNYPSRNPRSLEYHVRGEMIQELLCTLTEMRGVNAYDPEEQAKTIDEAYALVGIRRPPWANGLLTHSSYPQMT